jgi:hypothetical protein
METISWGWHNLSATNPKHDGLVHEAEPRSTGPRIGAAEETMRQRRRCSKNLNYLSSEENCPGKGGRGPFQRAVPTFSSVCPFVAKISAESQTSGLEALKISRRGRSKNRRREISLFSQGLTTTCEPTTTPRSRQKRTWAEEKASWRIDTGMQTFHEFLAKKAVLLPNLFRIEPFIGLAQPIPLKSTDRTKKPDRRHRGVTKPARIP